MQRHLVLSLLSMNFVSCMATLREHATESRPISLQHVFGNDFDADCELASQLRPWIGHLQAFAACIL